MAYYLWTSILAHTCLLLLLCLGFTTNSCVVVFICQNSKQKTQANTLNVYKNIAQQLVTLTPHDSSMAFLHTSDEVTTFFKFPARKEATLQVLPSNRVLIKNSTSDNLGLLKQMICGCHASESTADVLRQNFTNTGHVILLAQCLHGVNHIFRNSADVHRALTIAT